MRVQCGSDEMEVGANAQETCSFRPDTSSVSAKTLHYVASISSYGYKSTQSTTVRLTSSVKVARDYIV